MQNCGNSDSRLRAVPTNNNITNAVNCQEINENFQLIFVIFIIHVFRKRHCVCEPFDSSGVEFFRQS